jgi:hypothetical protein
MLQVFEALYLVRCARQIGSLRVAGRATTMIGLPCTVLAINTPCRKHPDAKWVWHSVIYHQVNRHVLFAPVFGQTCRATARIRNERRTPKPPDPFPDTSSTRMFPRMFGQGVIAGGNKSHQQKHLRFTVCCSHKSLFYSFIRWMTTGTC